VALAREPVSVVCLATVMRLYQLCTRD